MLAQLHGAVPPTHRVVVTPPRSVVASAVRRSSGRSAGKLTCRQLLRFFEVAPADVITSLVHGVCHNPTSDNGGNWPHHPTPTVGARLSEPDSSVAQEKLMLAYEYPILGAFWTILMIFIWVAWIFLVFRIFIDIFRSKDLGGWGKALWSIFVILIPFLGVLLYLIVRGGSMAERDVEDAQKSEEAFRAYVQQAAGGTSAADELAKLAQLHNDGVISDSEFESQKARLLA